MLKFEFAIVSGIAAMPDHKLQLALKLAGVAARDRSRVAPARARKVEIKTLWRCKLDAGKQERQQCELLLVPCCFLSMIPRSADGAPEREFLPSRWMFRADGTFGATGTFGQIGDRLA